MQIHTQIGLDSIISKEKKYIKIKIKMKMQNYKRFQT